MQNNYPEGLIKPFKSRQEIQNEYGMSYKVFRKKLEVHQIQLPAGVVTPKFQMEIYEAFGLSLSFEEKTDKKGKDG